MQSIYLIATLALIGMYIGGAIMSIFGPSPGRLLGVIAFLAMLPLFGIMEYKRRRGSVIPIVQDPSLAQKFSTLINSLMVICVIAFIICFVVAAIQPGVTDGGRPVFDLQQTYQLCNHGEFTEVSRTRYLVEGTCSVVCWHAFGVFMALIPLHVFLVGRGNLFNPSIE